MVASLQQSILGLKIMVNMFTCRIEYADNKTTFCGLFGHKMSQLGLSSLFSSDLHENIWSWMKKDAGGVEPITCEEIKAALFKSSDRICPAKSEHCIPYAQESSIL